MEEQEKIKERNSWNQFLASGRVEDYLSYTAVCKETKRTNNVEAKWAGEGSHAGVYRSNRNHIEADAYR